MIRIQWPLVAVALLVAFVLFYAYIAVPFELRADLTDAYVLIQWNNAQTLFLVVWIVGVLAGAMMLVAIRKNDRVYWLWAVVVVSSLILLSFPMVVLLMYLSVDVNGASGGGILSQAAGRAYWGLLLAAIVALPGAIATAAVSKALRNKTKKSDGVRHL